MDKPVEETQLIKLRRRIEHFLRNSTPQMVIRIAMFCGIKISQNLIKKYMSKNESWVAYVNKIKSTQPITLWLVNVAFIQEVSE